jgi:hypothetical protein
MHARCGDGGRDERVRIAEHGGREKEPRQRELKHVLRVSVKLLNKKNTIHTYHSHLHAKGGNNTLHGRGTVAPG